MSSKRVSATPDSAFFLPAASGGNAGNDYEDLRNVALADMQKKGAGARIKRRFGSQPNLADKKGSQTSKSAQDLVQKVMETSGGDNAELARKVHERFEKAGLKQPSVEVRFDDLCASAVGPEGAADGLFTVGVDLQVKAMARSLSRSPMVHKAPPHGVDIDDLAATPAVHGVPVIWGQWRLQTAVATAARIKPPMATYRILQNVSGVLKPGRVTLLLGPPGGGKSMLMQALCGAAPVGTTGSITYNGHNLSEFNVVRTARYIAQFDLHNPQLTVRETLTFSAMVQGPGYNTDLLRLLEERERAQGIAPDPAVAELMSGLHHNEDPSCNVALTLQLLSLVNCADTIVGDAMTRGISGGERKRVTTGEFIVGPSKVLFMDEISTGLDSASTFTIVQSLANWSHATDATIVIGLLQPEPQVFEQFDDVLLLANGRIAYHGPREAIEPYFFGLGFEVPEKKAVADFLQELVSKKDQPALRADRSKFEPQVDFVPASAFAAGFRRSSIFAETRARLDQPFNKANSHPAALLTSMYGIPGWEHVKALMWREKILLTRNKSGQVYRYVQMAVLAIMLATLFVQGEVVHTDSVRGASAGLSVHLFSMAYMQFLGLAECAETMMRLPVFYKQKFALFFPSWAYAIPFGIIRIPITAIEVTAWSLVVYFTVGFEYSAGRFFTFWAILATLQIYSASFFRLIGTTFRSIVLGTSTAVIAMLLTFLGCGFVLLRPDIPKYWIWMFWVSPLQYALTGMANNELLGKDYDIIVPELTGSEEVTLGRFVLENFGVNIGNKWRWITPLVLLAYYVLLNLLNMAALTYLPPPPMPPPAPPPEEEEYILSDLAEDEGSDARRIEEVRIAMSKRGVSSRPGSTKRTLDYPFEPVVLAFKDLHYFVPNPAGAGELELLRGVSGVFKPGILTALMGASGAGKSTLMDVISDRKTVGRAEGRITVNGFDKKPATFARVMGYCEQFDIHSPGLTVGESIHLSADLRLSSDITTEQKEALVEQTLNVVELESISGQIVGLPGMYGLSGEQRKRLTIAVELAANPSILFMDEPTSGLDARSAAIVMRVVRAIVDTNRTIVCTIHQPSTEIFLNFDDLLLLKRGGWPIYYGPLGEDAGDLVRYLKTSAPAVKDLARGYNPATWMLEVSTQAEEERLGIDFADLWRNNQEPQVLAMTEAAQKVPESADAHELSFPSEYSQSRLQQFKVLLNRYFKSYWRSPPYNTTRLILAVLSGLIFGSFFFGKGDKYETPQDITNVLGSLFLTTTFTGFINFQMIIPTFVMERPVMWRERASKLYSVLPWVESMQDVEIPWIMLQSLLNSIITYFMIQFEFDVAKFFFFWLVQFLSCATLGYLGMLVVCITPDLTMAVTIGSSILGAWFMMSGFMLPRPYTPDWWLWFTYLTPPGWSMLAITVDQAGDKVMLQNDIVQNDFNSPGGVERTVKQYLEDEFDYTEDMKWPAVAILLAFVVFLRLAVVVTTKFLNFQKR